MNSSFKTDLSSDEKKRLESETWHGKADYNLHAIKKSEIRYKNWNDYLLNSVFQKQFTQDKTILNVGGGDGHEAEFLLSRGASSVVLIDIAPGQLKSAKLRIFQHHLSNLDLLRGDAENLGIKDKQFDIGLIFMALHHFPDHEKTLTELNRVSKKLVIIDIMNCDLTKIFNRMGLFLTEGNLIINRVDEKTIQNLMHSNKFTFNIKYFFVPPYYGNNWLIFQGIGIMERTINYFIPKNRYLARFFGNIAIIEGQ
jgi:ubiquinone/menaquinone biosynthesis C-methylase UbiE